MFSARGNFLWQEPTGNNDPYWNNVSYLQNYENTLAFLDNSTNNFPVSRNGEVRPSLASPFSTNGSVYITGATPSLSVPYNSIFNLGTQSFTAECWVYVNTLSVTGNLSEFMIINNIGGSYAGARVVATNTGAIYFLCAGSVNTWINNSTTPAGSIASGAWYHLAAVRNGNTFTLYVNGVNRLQYTSSASIHNGNGATYIGNFPSGTSFTGNMNGFIAGFRVVVGTAVYTANFTPSTTPLTAITNTALLINGNGQSMLNNLTFIDQSLTTATLTLHNTPYYSGLSPFGNQYPGSVFYNTSSALETSSTATMPSGTGAYTVEAWIYLTALPANTSQGICTSYTAGGFYFGVGRSYNGDVNGLQIGRAYQADCENCAFTWSLNTWYHVAVVRSGTTIYFFVNGTQQTTVTPSSTASYSWPSSSGARFGGGGNATTRDALFRGYISNFRVTNSALYTSNFTPSTTPLGVSSSTKVLIGASTGGFYELKNGIPTYQTGTQFGISLTSQFKKFGNQSLQIIDRGLNVLDNTNLQLGTSDFTIEGWIYRTATTTQTIIGKGASTTGWEVRLNAANQLQFISGSTTLRSSTNTVSINTWTYFAITRSGTTGYMFLNGTQQGTTFTDSANYTQTEVMILGATRGDDRSSVFVGYLDDIRITKGVCRYTASFTAPTSPFPTS